MPFAVNAAGLGKLNVTSGLGEPLNAEIEVLSTANEDLSELSASIAPEEAYSLQGIERPALHNAISVEVRRRASGSSYLKLTTSQPVTDPFLDMLVQVDWPTGRLLREFTLLLDPPGYSSGNGNVAAPAIPIKPDNRIPANANGQQASDGATGSNGNARKRGSRRSAVAAVPSATASDSASVENSDAITLKTARGDSLSTIARQNQVEGVSLDQMLVGIYRANQNAFNGNMNRLKVGQIVRIPDSNELQAVSRSQASQEVRVQATDWRDYRNRLAGAVADAPAAPDDGAGNQGGSGRLTGPAEDQATPPATGPRDVVKLSKNDTAQSAENKSLQDKLSALQEETIAREKSIKEANDRTAALEKQIQDMQKLLAIKSQSLAQMQNNAATPAPEAKPVVPASPAPEAAVPPVTTAQPEAVPATPAPAAEVKPAPAVVKPAVTPPVAAPAPEVEQPGVLDSVLEDPLLPGVAGGLLVLLLGGWLYLRNKRKRGLDGFEKSILTAGGLKANTVFGNTVGGNVDTGDTSFLTDFSPSGGGMIDTNDVDPIAEAEVYMAYGRDRQAEEILRDAIGKEPNRHELHMKLLEVYASRNDASAFEALAGELYTTLGSQDPTWAKVAELGRKVEPENPLYQGVDAPSASDRDNSGKLSIADFLKEEDAASGLGLDDIAKPLAAAGLAAGLAASVAHQDEADTIDTGDTAVDFGASPLVSDNAADDNSMEFDSDRAFETDLSSAEDELQQFVQANQDAADQHDTSLDFDLSSLQSLDETSSAEDSPSADDTLSSDNEIDFDIASAEPAATLDLDLSTQTAAGTAAADKGFIDTLTEAPVTQGGSSLPEFDISAFDVPATQTDADVDATLISRPFVTDTADDDAQGLPDTDNEPALPASDQVATFDPEFETVAPEISFDLPEAGADLPAVESDIAPETVAQAPLSELSGDADAAEEIVFDTPVVEAEDDAMDLNFDVDLDEEEGVDPTSSPAAGLAAPEMDLSGISFDLDEDEAPAPDTDLPGAAESSEVDTKLDLVTAYIDMGDDEGAKELLEEVLKEGGINQRQRAQELLKSLG